MKSVIKGTYKAIVGAGAGAGAERFKHRSRSRNKKSRLHNTAIGRNNLLIFCVKKINSANTSTWLFFYCFCWTSYGPLKFFCRQLEWLQTFRLFFLTIGLPANEEYYRTIGYQIQNLNYQTIGYWKTIAQPVLWSRSWSRKEPELLARAGSGAGILKFLFRLPAPGQNKVV